MDDRLSAPVSFEATAALGAELPAAFELSAPVIDFTAAPFSEVSYAYPGRPAARVALDGLPEPMRHELLWWLCSLHAGGERMNSWTLQQLVRITAVLAADPKRPVDSFACLSVESGSGPPSATSTIVAAGCRRGRSSTPTERRSRGCTRSLERAYGSCEWWRSDVWEPRRDPRIPVREHEPIGNARLRFAEIAQSWLREAIKWFFARALEQGVLA